MRRRGFENCGRQVDALPQRGLGPNERSRCIEIRQHARMPLRAAPFSVVKIGTGKFHLYCRAVVRQLARRLAS